MKTTKLLLAVLTFNFMNFITLNCSAQCNAGITSVLQPGPKEGKDAYVRINDDWDSYKNDVNHGNEGTLEFRYYSSTSYNRRIFIQFNNLPADTVNNAILKIYLYHVSSGYTYNNIPFAVRKVTSAWAEDSITAANQPTYTTTDYASANVNLPSNYGWYSWDITALVNEWITNPSSNFGLVMLMTQTASWGGANAYSSEHANVSLRPKLELSGTNVSTATCNNDTTVLTASGGTNYLWNTGETTESIKVSPDATTVYSVTIDNDTSCTAKVTVNVASSASVIGTTNFCKEDSTQLTASGGTSYLWNTTETTPTITVNTAKDSIYSVIISGSCSGINDTIITTITVDSLVLTASITGDTIICNGDTAVLAASGATDYVWNTGDKTETIAVKPSANTTYSVTATNVCSDTTSITVTVNANPSAPIVTKNENVLTSNSATGNQWYKDGNPTADTTQNYTATANGNYYVIVTNSDGCFASSSIISVTGVGINDQCQASGTQFQVFPNPNDGNFELEILNYKLIHKLVIKIYDVLGREIYKSEITNQSFKIQNLKSKIDKGVYFLQLTTEEGVWNEKIIVNY